MYREHYKLSAEPFRLSVDPSLVSAHRSYRSARRHMRLALEQGDGILVVTGRSGTGKTTLIKDFLAKLCPGEVLSAAVVGTPLKSESVLRMAGYAFGLDAKQLDEATLLCELQGLLSRQAHARALLVIDEAHNLSAEALEQVRMLANMQAGEGPALQIFLVGQEQLHETLHTPQMQQLHQRIMATCSLEPLNLQEIHDYVLHRLHVSDWRGNPAIVTHAFVMLHRFSQGLPRYINKLGARLLAFGAQHKRHTLSLDDVVTVIDDMQKEMLLPLPCESQASNGALQPLLQDLINSKALPTASRFKLSIEERVFVDGCPSVVQSTPAGVVKAAKQERVAVIRFTAAAADPADADHSSVAPAAPGPAGRELIRQFGQRSFGIMSQACRSASRVLLNQSKRFLGWAKNLPVTSWISASAAPLLWAVLKDYSCRMWTTLAKALAPQLPDAQRLIERVGRRKVVGCCCVSLLLLVGGFMLATDNDDQRRDGAATIAAAQLPVSRAIAPGPAASSGVRRQQPLPSNPSVPGATGARAAAEPERQAAQSQIAEAAKPGHSPEPEQAFEAAAPEPGVGHSAAREVAYQAVAAQAGRVVTPDPAREVKAVTVAAQQERQAATPSPVAVPDEPALNTTEAQIEELLLLGDQALARDRLRVPKQQNAWYYYREVLAIDPDNKGAQDGFVRIAARYHDLAAYALHNQALDKAQRYIQRGLGVVPRDSALLALQEDVQRQRDGLQAQQAREELLARDDSTEVDPQPEPAGLLGFLKTVFTGNSSDQ